MGAGRVGVVKGCGFGQSNSGAQDGGSPCCMPNFEK